MNFIYVVIDIRDNKICWNGTKEDCEWWLSMTDPDNRPYYKLEEKYVWVHTADDEEPNCMSCDNVCGSQEKCDKCGSKYWWQHYKRTEVEQDD